MKSITPDRCQQELQEKGGADFAIEYVDGYRFRVAIFKQKGTIGMVLRRIPSQFLTFEQIGMPDAIRSLIVKPRGLILVTGPTGSGKTTSLASMINFLNENYDRHVITLEDPIEYYHKHKKCTVNQREIGVDCPSSRKASAGRCVWTPTLSWSVKCATWRRSTRRSKRPKPATSCSPRCTPPGRPARSTASSTCSRKEQQDQVRTQLSTALIGVLSQGILPRKPEGLVAAFEMMVVTPAIQNLIRENKVYRIDSSIQTGRKHGMFLLDESLFRLWKDGLCEKEEVLLKSSKPAELAAKIAAPSAARTTKTTTRVTRTTKTKMMMTIDDDDDDEDDRPKRGRIAACGVARFATPQAAE